MYSGNVGGARRTFEPVPRGRWTSKNAVERCAQCNKSFGIFRPADNCQACGRVFCSGGCLSNSMVLPGSPGSAPVPVCDGCASSIRRVQQDAEVAVHRCQILEDLLNEQTLQSEKLITRSNELREENDRLVEERAALQNEVTRLGLQLEVAAARSSLRDGGDTAPADATAAASPPTPQPTQPSPSAEADEALEKRKRSLDMREATLQEALKKVSNDAAKISRQRSALQSQERELQEHLTQQFAAVFEEQREALEASLLEERDALHAEFALWMADQSSAPPAVGVPPAEVEAMRAALENQLAEAARAHRLEVEALQGEAAAAAQADQEAQARRWEEDKFMLENTVGALKRALAEARAEADASTEAADGRREVAMQEQLDAAAREAEQLRTQHEITTGRFTARIQQLQRDVVATEEEGGRAALSAAHTGGLERLGSEREGVISRLKEKALAAEVERLTAALGEWERAAAEKEAAWEASRAAALAEQAAALQQAHALALEEATAALAEELSGARLDRDSLREQCLVLQAEVGEYTEEALRWQADRARGEGVVEVPLSAPPSATKAGRGADDLLGQPEVLGVLEVVNTPAATPHSDRGGASPQTATAPEPLEVVKRLQRQLKAARREAHTHEQRAAGLAQEVLQHKRDAAAQATEIEQLRERLKKTHRGPARGPKGGTSTTSLPSTTTTTTAAAAAGQAGGREVAALLDRALEWHRATAAVAMDYVGAASAVAVPAAFVALADAAEGPAAAVERYRAAAARNAAALEHTTNTIRVVQEDLRQKAAALEAREAALQRRAKKIAAAGAAVEGRRVAIGRLCSALRSVAGQLRERERGLSEEALAAVEAGSAALFPGGAEDPAGLEGLSPISQH